MRPALVTLGLLIALVAALPAASQAGYKNRKEFLLPQIPGYQLLKCDLHMHTVFSDGRVWPKLRVEEAWRDGLDCMAITEHVERQIYHKDIPPDIDRPTSWPAPRPVSWA